MVSKELHDAIMNLQCDAARGENEPSRWMAYKVGHRDARHAAAELALAAPATEDDTLVRELRDVCVCMENLIACSALDFGDGGNVAAFVLSIPLALSNRIRAAARAESQASRGLPEDVVAMLHEAKTMRGHNHWDHTMQHGAGCEACIHQIEVCQRINDLLAKYAPATPVKETNR